MNSFFPVVLSGGSGTRLWPMSRKLLPKQFLPLVSAASLFQDTVARVTPIEGCRQPIVVCNDEQRFLAAEQLREIGVVPQLMLLEPVGRNTAPAIAAAALAACEIDAETVLLVLPSDHAITRPDAFRADLWRGLELAAAGYLVTFGISPSHPATGYGYIEQGTAIDGHAGCHTVSSFREKPDRATAEKFVADGRHFWNSGIFAFRAAQYLAELDRYRPDIVSASRSAFGASTRDLDFLRLGKAEFEACASESIDYAVMEHTAHAAVVASDCGWSDVGSWSALWDIAHLDAEGNAAVGDTYLSDCKRSYVRAESRLVAAIGIEDLLVVETKDAVLVADKRHAQEVKALVDWLAEQGRGEHISHRRVYRPWGYYEGLDDGERFQVKRIMVKPGEALSLQLHHHRAEHWVVVTGTARVTRGEEEFLLKENESTFIPLGTRHRLVNPGKVPLHLIEVQSGGYLGEDDIVRFEDRYRRT